MMKIFTKYPLFLRKNLFNKDKSLVAAILEERLIEISIKI